MTAEDLEVLAGFEAVWQRVMQGGEPAPVARVSWKEQLAGLQTLWLGCRQMSCCAGGEPRRCLQGLAKSGEEAFHSLQTEYFLECGDIFVTEEICDFASYTPCNLRKLWKQAVELAEDLQNARQGEFPAFADAARTVEDIACGLKHLIRRSLQ